MMARMAGKAGPPAMQPFAPNDYATGLLGAFALGLALFHRGQTGQAQRVHTSLAAAASVPGGSMVVTSKPAGVSGSRRLRNATVTSAH